MRGARPFSNARHSEAKPKQSGEKARYAAGVSRNFAPDNDEGISGKFSGNARGYGFVMPENGGEDIFIPPDATNGALDGDIVLCKIVRERSGDSTSRHSGRIAEIVSRGTLIGTFFTEGKHGYVRPVESKIPYIFTVPPKAISRFGLVDGHRIIFTTDKRGNVADGIVTCFVTEVLGHIHDPGMDVLTLVRQAGVQYEFPSAAMDEANAKPESVTDADMAGRLDLRDTLTFTIDGDDTKDIDDAISFVQNSDGGYRLGVHIADVSHYVTEGTALDKAAQDRGTSIYLADRVIPMLPYRLSSGICSLFEGVDRLTLSCLMEVNADGFVTAYEITPSVIRSAKRWTYDKVQEILDTGQAEDDWPAIIHDMDKLRATLRKNRERKGALDFNLPEAKIRVDETGTPISIESRGRTHATGIIEEFMILCNETVAAHCLASDIPSIYRTHEPPTSDRMAKLAGITKPFGYKTPKSAESPLVLQRLLNRTENTPAAYAIATAVLHSLPQARYTTDIPTHYGLASSAYCHFTSPIRRYADLQVHREIRRQTPNTVSLDTIAAICSRTERIAEALEREVEQLKKVQYMAAHAGEVFAAVVSGVTAWGVYVMLANTVEGLIPFENLRRHGFVFDKEKNIYESKSRKKSKVITLRHGEALQVRLSKVDTEERKLTFTYTS